MQLHAPHIIPSFSKTKTPFAKKPGTLALTFHAGPGSIRRRLNAAALAKKPEGTALRRFGLRSLSRRRMVLFVLPRLTKLCLALLLVLSIGGQWALLQSVAWVGMLVDYSRDSSFGSAITRTFDGRHPCPICRAIAAAKKSEQKKALSPHTQKLEFPPLIASTAPVEANRRAPAFPHIDSSGDRLGQKPLTPPPRFLPA